MKRIAVDTGGTFTDIVYYDEDKTQIVVDKVATTPESLESGVLKAIKKIKADMCEIAIFFHGATTGVNTLIEKTGSKVGLITTKGFRDVLEIGRGGKDELYNLLWKKPKPLVPRYNRLEVSERTNYKGEIIEELNEREVVEVVTKLMENGVESIAVCLLHSYANLQNEEKIADIIKKSWPEINISLSHKVVREYREFERTSTTVIDAYIKRNVAGYLTRLLQALESLGFTGQALIASTTGVLTIPMAIEKTVSTIQSGPMAGAIGADFLANSLGMENVLAADVGGTSFDVSLIIDGRSVESEESSFMGYPILTPGIDIQTIGAGGGSIATIDSGGLLHVGPKSAGANPGPMCYGRGGAEPTVTDAALVNGLINPNYFLHGKMPLDIGAAQKGVTSIAKALGSNISEAADAILAVAKANMADVCTEILVGRGHDPRDFAMIAYGGAGGLFAGSVASEVGISRVIIPPSPGVFSAWGMLSGNIVHNFAQTLLSSLSTIDIREIEKIYQEMEDSAIKILREEGLSSGDIELVRSVTMRYEGQGHEVKVPVPSGPLGENTKKIIEEAFKHLHEARYGYQIEFPIETVNFRLRAIGKVKPMPIKEIQKGDVISPDALKPSRRVYLNADFVECQIYERDKLDCGNTIRGPAIIEEPTHTTIVAPVQTLKVDKFGNLVINTGEK